MTPAKLPVLTPAQYGIALQTYQDLTAIAVEQFDRLRTTQQNSQQKNSLKNIYVCVESNRSLELSN
jgi:hypothetical protein